MRKFSFLLFTLLCCLPFGCGTGLERGDATSAPNLAGGGGGSGGSTGPLRIFVTTSTTDGAIGGIAAADTFCTNDANKPATGTYRAMLVDGVSRAATVGAQINWVLRANTAYIRPDGTEIGTTNADAVFSFPLTNSFGTGGAVFTWTGLTAAWGSSANHCVNWTSNAAAPTNGTWAAVNATNSNVISNNFTGCDVAGNMRLYCVEQ